MAPPSQELEPPANPERFKINKALVSYVYIGVQQIGWAELSKEMNHSS
jgi:hypothetical protein